MLNVEISQLMNEDGKMMNWATKVKHNIELSAEDKEISEVVDAWAKKIGRGETDAYALSQYLVKTVQPEVYNAPDEIFDKLFNRGSVGEFDDFQINEDAKNMLNPIEAAKNGNVDKSYIDYSIAKPIWKHFQVETEVSMEKLRKGGYKTVADLQMYAEEAFRNTMFYTVFNYIDSLITAPSPQGFTTTGSLTASVLDDASGYLVDRADSPMLFGLSSLIRPINKLPGFTSYMSEDMKNEINKYGILGMYNGTTLIPISASRKLANGNQLLPANRLIGVSDKIGELDMRGSLRVLQTPNNNRETIDLKFTGFEFGMAINKLDKVCKIAIV